MITADQMRAIIVARGLQLIAIKSNGGAFLWLAKTSEGFRAGPKHAPYSTPEEAIEAAELHFIQSDLRELESKASKIISALERGRYFIRVRNQSSTNPEGEPITIKLFSAILPNGNTTPVVDRTSFTQAVIDMEKLLS